MNQSILDILPDWRPVNILDITSSRKYGRKGLLPISRSTWLNFVKKGIAPQGRNFYGRTNFWTVGEIREFAKKITEEKFNDEIERK